MQIVNMYSFFCEYSPRTRTEMQHLLNCARTVSEMQNFRSRYKKPLKRTDRRMLTGRRQKQFMCTG